MSGIKKLATTLIILKHHVKKKQEKLKNYVTLDLQKRIKSKSQNLEMLNSISVPIKREILTNIILEQEFKIP